MLRLINNSVSNSTDTILKLTECQTVFKTKEKLEQEGVKSKYEVNLEVHNATCNVEKENFNKDLAKCESDRERLREEYATLKEENSKCDACLLIDTKELNEKEQQIFKKLEECEKDKQNCMTNEKKCKDDKKKYEEEKAKKGWF